MAQNPMGTPFLRFDGASYFDTGIMATGASFEMEVTAKALNTTNHNVVTVGTQQSWDNPDNRFMIGKASNSRIWFANSGGYNNANYLQQDYRNVKASYYLSKAYFGINGERVQLGSGEAGVFSMNILIGKTQDDNEQSLMDFYELKLWNNHSLIADFVPKADNILYDKISRTTILNIGGGNAQYMLE